MGIREQRLKVRFEHSPSSRRPAKFRYRAFGAAARRSPPAGAVLQADREPRGNQRALPRARRQLALPSERMLDDGLQVVELRPPPERRTDAVRGGDDLG